MKGVLNSHLIHNQKDRIMNYGRQCTENLNLSPIVRVIDQPHDLGQSMAIIIAVNLLEILNFLCLEHFQLNLSCALSTAYHCNDLIA